MGLFEASNKLHYQHRYEQALAHIRKLEAELNSLNRKAFKAEAQNTTNPDTGLPNGSVLHRDLDDLLNRDDRPKALMFLALSESFDTLKRTFSTKIPEWILYQTSLRIAKTVGKRGRIYHTKEREFFVLLTEFEGPKAVYELARSLVSRIEKSHVMGGYTISLNVHVGFSLFPEHGTKKTDLLRAADIALAEARPRQTPVQPFTADMKSRLVEQVEIQNGILAGLEKQEEDPQFELVLQPQVAVRDWGPNPRIEVQGAEALVRWKHPSLGIVSPAKFIPVAEETGLIVPLSNWILHRAMSTLTGWNRAGLEHLSLSVNLSPRQFHYMDVPRHIQETVARRGIRPHQIKFEITESGLMENYHTLSPKVLSLRNMGFAILVDDFGTGYSSLAHLKNLPINTLKIDKTFVDGLPEDRNNQALVKAMVTMAQELNLGLIVEGTETRAQVEWLVSQGVRIFQGYFFSRPLTIPDFLQYVARPTWKG